MPGVPSRRPAVLKGTQPRPSTARTRTSVKTGGQKFLSQFLGLMTVGGREGLRLQQLAVGEYICQFNEGSLLRLPGS